MAVCGGVCIVLAIAMLCLRRQKVWGAVQNPCRILFIFSLMGLLIGFLEANGSGGIADGKIKRGAPGEGALETEAVFYLCEDGTEYPISLTIEERAYQKSEERSLISKAIKEIERTFCGENPSMGQIALDPVVSEQYQDGAVSAEWMFSKPDIISNEGKLIPFSHKEGRQEVEAVVALSCGESEELYRFTFWAVPGAQTKREQAVLEIQREIALQGDTEEAVLLPDEINGQGVLWKPAKSAQPFEILGLGVLAAIAAAYAVREQTRKKEQKRKRGLLLEYPEFVSKLSLLLGAGMSISGALRKMSQMYQKRRAEGGAVKEAYEELERMVFEMENGMGELRAYQAFSNRCGLQPYRKLASLLIAGQKVGNCRLREQLNEEVDRVFLERKNAARKLGEEAGTKMLLPMMMMLVIVMGIVVVPAFLSIYGK